MLANGVKDGRFVRVNKSLCEILGYPEQELLGKHVKEISHPEDRDVTDAERVDELEAMGRAYSVLDGAHQMLGQPALAVHERKALRGCTGDGCVTGFWASQPDAADCDQAPWSGHV